MKRRWIFILLVLALVIYFWGPMLVMVLEVEHEPERDQISTTKKPEVTGRPLDENTISAEHKPLGPPQEKGSAPSEEKEAILLEKITLADKNLGLSLVGTVLADDPKMNIAVIDNRSTRQQERYHEGDRIGGVLVKRIFWDMVIIETERGEELLVMLFEGTAGGSLHSSTDLEPTVSSGPLYGGSSSSVGAAARDGGNAAAGGGGSTSDRGTAVTGGSGAATDSGGSTLGRGTAATGGGGAATSSGGSFRSASSSSENSRSSSPESEEGDSSLTDPEPTVSSGPLL